MSIISYFHLYCFNYTIRVNVNRKKRVCKNKCVRWILNVFDSLWSAQWINIRADPWCTRPSPFFILFSYHVADFVVCSCRIDGNWAAGIRLWNGHRTGTTDLILIILCTTPKYSLFTLTIAYITIIVQHQYRIAAWRCLIWYIHVRNNYLRIENRKREKNIHIRMDLCECFSIYNSKWDDDIMVSNIFIFD